MAIQSFADATTERFFLTGKADRKAGWASLTSVAKRKLDMIHHAAKLTDLKAPPGSRLEELKGNLARRHGIHINGQWKIVFRCTDAGPSEVRFTDYH